MASQWPAIIGTLSGAGFGFASSWVLERIRWKQQRSVRWEELERLTYAEFLATLQVLNSQSRELRSHEAQLASMRQALVGPPGVSEDIRGEIGRQSLRLEDDGDQLMSRMHETLRDLAAQLGTLRMLSPPSIVDRAEMLFRSSYDLVHDDVSESGQNVQAVTSAYQEAYAAFVESCRRRLGV